MLCFSKIKNKIFWKRLFIIPNKIKIDYNAIAVNKTNLTIKANKSKTKICMLQKILITNIGYIANLKPTRTNSWDPTSIGLKKNTYSWFIVSLLHNHYRSQLLLLHPLKFRFIFVLFLIYPLDREGPKQKT